MVRKLFLFFLLQLLFTIYQLPKSFAQTSNLSDIITQKLQELQKVNEEIKQNQKQIETLQGQQKNLNTEIKKIDTTVKQVDLTIKSTEINLQKLGLELDQLGTNIQGTEKNIALKQSAVVKLVRTLQERNQETPLISFLRLASLSRAFLEIQTINQLNQNLLDSVSELKILNDRLTAQYEERTGKKQRVEQENRNLTVRKKILSDQKSEQANLLARTKNQEKIYQAQLAELEEKQAGISQEIGKIEAELRKNFDPTVLPIKRPGVLTWPVANPRVSQEYGETAFAARAYRTKFHNGVDFAAPTGTEILASESGRVIAVSDNGRYQYGKHVLIQHENNLTTLYAHFSAYGQLSGRRIAVGDIVKKGDVIGYMGKTGYAFGVHLHFTAYWSPSVRLETLPSCNCGQVPLGITVNPLDYLP